MKKPKCVRRAHPMESEPGVLVGPQFNVAGPSRWRWQWKPEGPMLKVNGRWLSAVRASYILYVARSTRCPGRVQPWSDCRWRMRHRIDAFLGRDSALPF